MGSIFNTRPDWSWELAEPAACSGCVVDAEHDQSPPPKLLTHAAAANSRRVPSSCNVPQGPLLRKLNKMLTIQERCLKEFCPFGQSMCWRVNLELRGSQPESDTWSLTKMTWFCDDGTSCICYVEDKNFSIVQKGNPLSSLLYPALCPKGLTCIDIKGFYQWGTSTGDRRERREWGQGVDFLDCLSTGFPWVVCIARLKSSFSPESLFRAEQSVLHYPCWRASLFSYFQSVTSWYFCK